MAGHSKWANIKRTKEREDAKRSKEFSKVAKEIETVVRLTENGDVGSNPNLKVLVDKAKSVNMPKDKIEKAINRGLGIRDTDDEVIYSNTYEFYGPVGTQLLVDCETENPNRTFSDIKVIGNKNALKIANEGSISWAFDTMARIIIETENLSLEDKEELQLEILEVPGITDIKSTENSVVIFAEKEDFKEVYTRLKDENIASAELIKKPQNTVKLGDEDKSRLEAIISNLEEMDEVINIWVNY